MPIPWYGLNGSVLGNINKPARVEYSDVGDMNQGALKRTETDMNPMQRYSRELVAAGHGAGEPLDTSLVWRGQLIERVDVPSDDNDEIAERHVSWLDRVVNDD